MGFCVTPPSTGRLPSSADGPAGAAAGLIGEWSDTPSRVLAAPASVFSHSRSNVETVAHAGDGRRSFIDRVNSAHSRASGASSLHQQAETIRPERSLVNSFEYTKPLNIPDLVNMSSTNLSVKGGSSAAWN